MDNLGVWLLVDVYNQGDKPHDVKVECDRLRQMSTRLCTKPSKEVHFDQVGHNVLHISTALLLLNSFHIPIHT